MIAVLCPFGLDEGLVSKAMSFSVPVRVLVPEQDAQRAALLGVQAVHTCYVDCADDRAVALWLKQLLTAWESTVVLAPGVVRLRGIMPILAWYMDAGLTADCTGLTMEAGKLLQTRPAFGNALMADIRSTGKVQMATVRPGTFPVVEKRGAAQFFFEEFHAADCLVELLEETAQDRFVPLHRAKIILAGGLGIGSREGFARLETLARKLGASVAASRAAVDAGYAPYRCQVGITGVTVCPQVYIAVGISGAVQHLAGMSGAQKVIAINSDPHAPIFDYADYGIVGNWERIFDTLWEELP